MGNWAEHWPERTIQIVDGTGVLVEVTPGWLVLRFYIPQAQEPHFTVRFTRGGRELHRAAALADALDAGRGDE